MGKVCRVSAQVENQMSEFRTSFKRSMLGAIAMYKARAGVRTVEHAAESLIELAHGHIPAANAHRRAAWKWRRLFCRCVFTSDVLRLAGKPSHRPSADHRDRRSRGWRGTLPGLPGRKPRAVALRARHRRLRQARIDAAWVALDRLTWQERNLVWGLFD